MEKWEKPKIVMMENEEPLGCMGAGCEKWGYEFYIL